MNHPSEDDRGRRAGMLANVLLGGLVRGLVIVGLVLMTPGAAPLTVALAQGEPPDRLTASLARLDTLLEGLDDLRGTVDRSLFDADALALDLAFEDAATIVEHVRERVRYEPYMGLLRGADGTLMSGAGNALDQAVLLARLLNAAGYDARIALGRIDEIAAEALIRQAAVPYAPSPSAFDAAAAQAILERLEIELGMPPGTLVDLMTTLQARDAAPAYGFETAVDDEAAFVLEALAGAGIALGDDTAVVQLVAEAREYAWVEYRLGEGAAWTSAHPAFHDPSLAPFEIEPQETLEGSVPERLQHRLRVEAFIDRRLGDEVATVPVMEPWEVPVANAVGRPFTYTNLPDGLAFAGDLSQIDPAGVAADSRLFFPVFDGRPASGAQAFDLLGNTVPADAAASPMAGVFQTGGAAVARAATALDALSAPTGRSEVGAALLGHTVRYSLIAPDGRVTSYDRAVAVDADDPVASVAALAVEQTFMVAAGRMSDGYVLDRLLARAVASGPLLRVALIGDIDPERDVAVDDADLDASELTWSGHLLLFQAFDEPAAVPATHVTYRPTPALVVRHYDALPRDGRAREVIDVVANPRRTLVQVGGDAIVDAVASVRAGVWETYAEGIFVNPDATDAFSTMAALRAADGTRLPVAVVAPDGGDRLVDLAPDAVALESLRRDLAAGYVVIVPVDVPTAAATGWWRVDPATGETLGIISDGRGAVVTTALGLATIVAFAAVFTCFAVADVGGDLKGKTWDCLGTGVGVGTFFLGPVSVGAFILLALSLAIGFLDVADVPVPF